MRTWLTTVMTAIWTLAPGVLWAQGTSPWVDAVNELQTQFTGPIARGLSLIDDRGGRTDVRIRRGREQAHAGRDHLRDRDGGARGELPCRGSSDAGPQALAGDAALNRPLTVLGVERRLFLLGATLAVAVWNATASLVAGGMVFAACLGVRPSRAA